MTLLTWTLIQVKICYRGQPLCILGGDSLTMHTIIWLRHVKFVQGRSYFPDFNRKDRGKCALWGFKLRYTGLSIDRHPSKCHVSS